MNVILINHGLKHLASLPNADLYIDCRVLPDIRGDCETYERQSEMESSAKFVLNDIEDLLMAGIDLIPTRRENSPKKEDRDKPVIICFICAWGSNRSMACKHIMGRRLASIFHQHNVEVR